MINKTYLELDNWKYMLSPKFLSPRKFVPTINEIDSQELKKLGIKNIIFDLDFTLSGYHGRFPSIVIKHSLEILQKQFRCAGLSNFMQKNDIEKIKKRKEIIQKNFKLIPFISKDKKPSPKAFSEVLIKAKFNREETAVVGDVLIADIVGGNRAGMYTILVDHLHKESMPTIYKILARLERAMYKIYFFFGLIKVKIKK